MDNELERIGKEEIVAKLEVISWNLSARIEKPHETSVRKVGVSGEI
jgi:hypothetical protein